MAVSLETSIKRFNGLSTDDKPTTDVPEGSIFHIVDTGELYIFTGGMWEPDLRLSRALEAVL